LLTDFHQFRVIDQRLHQGDLGSQPEEAESSRSGAKAQPEASDSPALKPLLELATITPS
jgi:hypothetical protein